MEMPFDGVFNGRKVFVTGHTGFKGSWLCLWLNRLGAEVVGYALAPPTNPSHYHVANVYDVLVKNYEADIRDFETLNNAMQETQPDIVLHLAAQTVVRESYRIPRETFDINAVGTASVLDAVRELKRPCVALCITSDKCYENVEQLWGYRETDAFGDHDPYGGSKGAAEIVVRSYRHSFFAPERLNQHGVKLASARAGNVIGGGDWTSDALIVDLVKSLENSQPVELRNPHAYRPWQHVLQALSGYLTLVQRLLQTNDTTLCDGWNIGPLPGNELSVRGVVETFLEEWGTGSWRDVSHPDQLREATLLHLAIDKAMWRLPWKPCWTVQETLQKTAQWYKAWFEGPSSMRDVSLAQIEEYEQAFVASQGRLLEERGIKARKQHDSTPLVDAKATI
ncbi:CDP-glucose 4,6-dehydratase [Thalassoroseus pseudoceratinae]|uniref:CDP-glucose 4,6-dehydratase n=1 Tax=Thalassoroseus pseudoceratinae TaxID=2713176 RepID=UPI00141E6AF7|nr:CDP-glucose 4,6-dehydratase [Thalassoroseus pseudoceratinae]